jgi:hypothetical protein
MVLRKEEAGQVSGEVTSDWLRCWFRDLRQSQRLEMLHTVV